MIIAILLWRIVGEHNLLKSMFFQGYWSVRAGRLGLAIHVRPLTSDDHNFFVRAPFRVFLDSMESPVSLYYIDVPVEDSD